MSDATKTARPDVTAPRDAGPTQLRKITTLLGELDRAEIRYCHWKSNYAIKQALAGEGDLDLLVDKEHFAAFVAILLQQGFKQAESDTSRQQPGVFHFLGNDDRNPGLVNVHAYVRILTGDHLLKTWAIPLEPVLLTDTRRVHGICLPSKAAEMLVFVFRNMVKHTTVLDAYLGWRSRKAVLKEYQWIVSGSCMDDAYRALAVHFPMISRPLFRSALESIGTEGAMLRRIRMGLRFERALAKYRRYGRVRQTWLTAAALCAMAVRKLLRSKRRKTLLTGGAVIAVVGPPAAARSVLAERIGTWLGKQLSVRVIRPDCRQRKRLLRRAYRDSRNGRIIVCDGYPTEPVGEVDGPDLRAGTTLAQASPFKRHLLRWGSGVSRNVCPPDLVVELRAAADSAAEPSRTRNCQLSPETGHVHGRDAVEHQTPFLGCPVITIHTDRDGEETFLDVRRAIWEHL